MIEEKAKGGSTAVKFDVTGMDCSSCVSKIETAVGKIAGASDVKVGLQSQTLTVQLDDAEKATEVRTAVSDLGYGILQKSDQNVPHSEGDRGDHSGHAQPIEGAWWQSSKGRVAIATGAVIVAGYIEQRLLPYGSFLIFLAASVVGTIPVAWRAFAALRSGWSSPLKC